MHGAQPPAVLKGSGGGGREEVEPLPPPPPRLALCQAHELRLNLALPQACERGIISSIIQIKKLRLREAT